MARRDTTIVIGEDGGRDKGKTFILTEMPATAGEKWAMQLMYLMQQNGVDLSPQAASSGMAGLADALSAKKREQALAMGRALGDPSLAAWWDCVRYQHAPGHPLQKIEQGDACQIEEIKTIASLRMEVVKLHTDFFPDDSVSTTESRSPAIPTGSSPTRISRPRSAQ
jgi:hypothetical protein